MQLKAIGQCFHTVQLFLNTLQNEICDFLSSFELGHRLMQWQNIIINLTNFAMWYSRSSNALKTESESSKSIVGEIALVLFQIINKPATLAVSGMNPSSFVKSSLDSFNLPSSSTGEVFRLRPAGFLVLCISLHFEPFVHLPVRKNSSHSSMCFLLHLQKE